MNKQLKSIQSIESFEAARDYKGDQVTVRYFHGKDGIPEEVIRLRKQTFIDERGFLLAEDLITENDRCGTHVAVYDLDGNLVGCTHVAAAEETDFGFYTGISRPQLTTSILSSRSAVDPTFRNKGVFSLLIYLAGRWGRMRGRKLFVGYHEEGNPAIRKMLRPQPIEGVPIRKVTGTRGEAYTVMACSVPLHYVCHRSFETLTKSMKVFVCRSLMPDELIYMVEDGIDRFYETRWFKRVYEGSLTKGQYIEAISNMHAYVKWTTRLLATIAGVTEDRELRGAFLEHLNGEVDHELMLERDLDALDWDVEYVRSNLSPNPDILKFMAMQQSLAGFERDPVMFLVAPLVAEGLSANIAPEFIAMLQGCIKSWGIENPKKVMSFLHSHVYTDGGERGHWQSVQKVFMSRIDSESRFQYALNLSEAMMESMCSSYNRYIDDADLAFVGRESVVVQKESIETDLPGYLFEAESPNSDR